MSRSRYGRPPWAGRFPRSWAVDHVERGLFKMNVGVHLVEEQRRRQLSMAEGQQHLERSIGTATKLRVQILADVCQADAHGRRYVALDQFVQMGGRKPGV